MSHPTFPDELVVTWDDDAGDFRVHRSSDPSDIVVGLGERRRGAVYRLDTEFEVYTTVETKVTPVRVPDED